MSHTDREPIWRLGDSWRDLRAELLDINEFTVVTENASTHEMNMEQRTATRVPGLLANRLDRDGQRRKFAALLVATPCGLAILAEDEHKIRYTGPLVAALPGCVATQLEQHRQLVERLALIGPVAMNLEGHPARGCGALYCPVTAAAPLN